MKAITVILAAALLVVSCKKEDDASPVTDPYATQKTQLKTTYADMAFAVYDDSYTTAVTLKTALYDFVNNPSPTTHSAAKQAWLAAREVYGQSEIFRFVDGPIDNTSDGPEGLINAWPMDEAYVDYVQGAPNAGIINDAVNFPTIDAATIISANEFGAEVNISTGYHAIEFLLWGQDLDANGAGARSYTDFLTVGGTNSNQARRGQYLKVLADILVSALDQVRDAWDPAGVANYRQTFLSMDNNTALRKMFNSLQALSGDELAGERIYVAYENLDQEDEHSCFSDNTHRDIFLNAQGISNLYKGTYTRLNSTVVTGYSMEDLVAVVAPAKNTQLMARFTTTETLIGLMYTPFDQAIVLPAERPKVMDVVTSLQAEQLDILSIAADFGITF
jgi:putative iron-regulated protein